MSVTGGAPEAPPRTRFPVAEADAWLAAQGERLSQEPPPRELLERVRLKSLRADAFFPPACTGGDSVEDLPPLPALVWQTLKEVQSRGAEASSGGSYTAFAMPRDLCLLELEGLCRTSSSWLVTPKDDGVRALLLVLYDKPFAIMRGKQWVTDLCPEVSFLAGGTADPGPRDLLLLDTERVEVAPGTIIYRVCDLLPCGRRSYMSLPFGQRLWLRDMLLKAHFSGDARPRREDWPCLATKTFVPLRDLQRDLLPRLERPDDARGWGFVEPGGGDQDTDGCRVPVDGLVFARGDAPYRGGGQRALRKWKFEQPTLDLEVLRSARTERGYWVCWGLRCPALRPWRPALHSEVAFDWASSGRGQAGGGGLLGGVAAARAAPGPPRAGGHLLRAAPRTLPREPAGQGTARGLGLLPLPAEGRAHGRQPGLAGGLGARARPGRRPGPAVRVPAQAIEELLRYKEAGAGANLTPRNLCFRVCGTDVQEAGSVVGLAYALPWQDHAVGLEGGRAAPPGRRGHADLCRAGLGRLLHARRAAAAQARAGFGGCSQ
eukprot:g76012.t1